MKKLLFIFISTLMVACSPKYKSLSLIEFEQTISNGDVVIVDVRTPQEFNVSHIDGALNIDWKSGQFVEQAGELLPNKEQTIAVYCIHAIRSKLAAEWLMANGYKNVVELAPGFEQWIKEGKPIICAYMNQTNNIEGMREVCQFVKDCGYYMLATSEDYQPRVRPFGTIHIFEGKLYIQTGHRKRTAQQLAKNGKAELCAYNTESHKWVRVCGTLVEDPRVEAKKSMLDDYSDLRAMYDENDDNTAVYFFTDATAWFSSFTEPDKEVKF